MVATARNTKKLASPPEERLAAYRKHVAFNEALKAAYEDSTNRGQTTAAAHARVAAEMNLTKAEVEAEVERVSKTPFVLELTPRLVVDEYVLGQCSREGMIERLKAWPYTFPAFVYADEAAGGELIGITPNSWSEVRAAYLAGEIDQDAFAQIEAASDRPATAS